VPRPKPRRVPTPEERRALMIRKAELTALAQHPSWAVLEAVLADKGERIKNAIAIEVLGGVGMSAERQSYLRGFVRGMAYVMVVPTNAEARLEELLNDQPEEGGVASA
jgi:hypothetical protein